jgi:dipeptidyl aminopeptidase/acylaminoacyl peptidase
VTFSDKITTPLMVIHSEEDWRTPIGQGEAMFRALKFRRSRP